MCLVYQRVTTFLKKKTSRYLSNINISKTLCTEISKKEEYSLPQNEKDWGSYLAGLIEGDGNFNHKRISICFSESDYNLAVLLKKTLNLGIIYKIKDKKAFNLIITKKNDIVRLLNLINGHLRTESKLVQIHEYIHE